ncbi:MAG: DUF3347 domain-containing protein [Flavobacteriaceae bacterium]|nr:DUF3347 domain-containing protein [Psychroflexus sp.]
MKTVKRSLGTLALAATMVLSVSCKDANQKEATAAKDNEAQQETTNDKKDMAMNASQESKSEIILKDYFNLKDALVNDNHEKAKDLGMTLTTSLKSFDVSNYTESEQTGLKGIIEDAKEHAEHISESPMEHQREHFDILSKDVIDMIAITGTDKKLYQDFCPMYNDNKGAAWLSTTKEIKNPYFGSKMMGCGKVQKEIN